VEKCQVCGGDIGGFQDGLRRCSSCLWPTDFAKSTGSRQAIDGALLGWAQNMYEQYVRPQIGGSNSSNVAAAPVMDGSTIQAVNEKVDRLTEFCKKLKETRTQDRQDYDQKLIAIAQEMKFLKDGIGHNQAISARVKAIEEWCNTVYKDILALQPETSSGAANIATSESTPAIDSSGNLAAAALLQVELNPAERELVELYNGSTDIAESFGVQDASLDPDTFNRLRDGDTSRIVFVAERKGTFVVVSKQGYLYLLPNKKRAINAHIYRSVKSIYNCTGYHEDYEKAVLIKPAVVQEIAPNQWQLSQPGILQFI
jgi:hypothetical protein